MTPELQQEFITFTKGEYLGDAVYASWDGYQIKLHTGDGYHQTIYLEDNVQNNLMGYIKRIREFRAAFAKGRAQAVESTGAEPTA